MAIQRMMTFISLYILILCSVNLAIYAFDDVKDVQNLQDLIDSEYQLNCNFKSDDVERAFKQLDNLLLEAVDTDLEDTIAVLFRKFGRYNFLNVAIPPANLTEISIERHHPDQVINAIPSDQQNTVTHSTTPVGNTHRYEGAGNDIHMLFEIMSMGSDSPKKNKKHICWFSTDTGENRKMKTTQKIIEVLFELDGDDVVLLDPGNVDIAKLHEGMCRTKPAWALYKQGKYALMKPVHLAYDEKYNMPDLPGTLLNIKQKRTKTALVDVIVFTDNNPIKAMALVESLVKFGKGLRKVWLMKKTNDKVIEDGYNLVKKCFKQLEINIIDYEDDKAGYELLEIFNLIIADYVIVLQENTILVNDVDFNMAMKFLTICDACFGFQLRLCKLDGDKYDIPEERFVEVPEHPDVLAYMPTHLPGQHGTVVHLDGLMFRHKSIMAEITRGLPKMNSMEDVENFFESRLLHKRSRMWQLIFTDRRFMRITRSTAKDEKFMEMASLLVEKHMKIDVDAFINKLETPFDEPNARPDITYRTFDCDNLKVKRQENEGDDSQVEEDISYTEEVCRDLVEGESCAVEVYPLYIEHSNHIDCSFDFTPDDIKNGFPKLQNIIPKAKSGFISSVKHIFRRFKVKVFLQLPVEIPDDVTNELRKASIPKAASIIPGEQSTVTFSASKADPYKGTYKGGAGKFRFLLHSVNYQHKDTVMLYYIETRGEVKISSMMLIEIIQNVKDNSIILFEWDQIDLFGMYTYMCRQKPDWAIFKQDEYAVLKSV